MFFTIHLHFITSNQISAYKKLNLPLSSSIFCLLISGNAKQTQTDQSMPHVFLQETTQKPLKVTSAKSIFSSVYMLLVELDSVIVFHSMWSLKDITFRESLSLPWTFFKRQFSTFFETSVLKEVRILCVFSTITTWC